MSLCETIRFAAVPRAVRVTAEQDALEARLEEASREAYRRGYAEAADVIERQLIAQRAEISHLQDVTFRAVSERLTQLIEDFHRALPLLAMEATRRVLAQWSPDCSTMERIVSELLDEIAPDSERVEVVMNPADVALVEGLDGAFREKHPAIEFRCDETLGRGDCVVRSRFGTIDGRIEAKLKTMEGLLI